MVLHSRSRSVEISNWGLDSNLLSHQRLLYFVFHTRVDFAQRMSQEPAENNEGEIPVVRSHNKELLIQLLIGSDHSKYIHRTERLSASGFTKSPPLLWAIDHLLNGMD